MIRSLRVLFGFIFLLMVALTIWASLDQNLLVGFKEVCATRWGIATLGDAYCGFLTFYAWVFYREKSWVARLTWFLIIMFFGNIAMSAYVLIVLATAGTHARAEDILLKRPV